MRHSDDPKVNSSNQWLTINPSFTKYQGNGNDFIIFTAPEAPSHDWLTRFAPKLCDRNRGVGADGIIVLTPSDSFVHMDVINADGSYAANCGNGLRCAASFWFKRHGVDQVVFALAERLFSCRKEGLHIHVDMGTCTLRSQPDFVFTSQDITARVCDGMIGNLHRQFFLDRATDFATLLPEVKAHYADINNINIGFVTELAPARFFSHVYERGVGWTQACGSGALVAGSFMYLLGRSRSPEVVIRQPGGELFISVTKHCANDESVTYHVTQRGFAQEIFTGICQDIESW